MNPQQPRQTKPPTGDAPERFDASNPEHVQTRHKDAKRREDIRREGMKYIMADHRGRAWMRHLLGEKLFARVGKVRPAPIFTGNSSTFYNAGLKEVGDLLCTELATMTPAEFRMMEDEGDTNAV